jgi:hypothetical protein
VGSGQRQGASQRQHQARRVQRHASRQSQAAKATADKERAYQLLAQGHDTVKDVRLIMKRTDTPVRRYFRQLEKEGRIEAIEKKEGGVFRWQVKPLSSLG